MKIVDKSLDSIRIVINGAGASGIAVAKLLLAAGARHMVLCDINGAISENAGSMNEAQQRIAKVTNRDFETGTLEDIIKGKDVFIGVSVEGVLTKKMVQTMNPDCIIFALANPVPEIMPEEAIKGGARIVATGRSDYPNQINNLLVFPGIFRGALDARVRNITEEMKLAAAQGIAELVNDEQRNENYIVPDAFDKRVSIAVSEALIRIARKTGVARI